MAELLAAECRRSGTLVQPSNVYVRTCMLHLQACHGLHKGMMISVTMCRLGLLALVLGSGAVQILAVPQPHAVTGSLPASDDQVGQACKDAAHVNRLHLCTCLQARAL